MLRLSFLMPAAIFALLGCSATTPSLRADELATCTALIASPPQMATAQFHNLGTGTREVYWVNPRTESLTLYRKLAAGESFDQPTFVGHYWLVSDRNSNRVSTLCVKSNNVTLEAR